MSFEGRMKRISSSSSFSFENHFDNDRRRRNFQWLSFIYFFVRSSDVWRNATRQGHFPSRSRFVLVPSVQIWTIISAAAERTFISETKKGKEFLFKVQCRFVLKEKEKERTMIIDHCQEKEVDCHSSFSLFIHSDLSARWCDAREKKRKESFFVSFFRFVHSMNRGTPFPKRSGGTISSHHPIRKLNSKERRRRKRISLQRTFLDTNKSI